MQAFSELLENLYYTTASNEKQRLLLAYLKNTPDPDRGWAIAALAGTLRFEFFKRHTVKQLMLSRVDPDLFAMSYDYVGEVSETVAHLWPDATEQPATLPTLNELVTAFQQVSKQKVSALLADYLSIMTPPQRWALLKLGTRGLRVGMSARSVKKVLATYGHVPVEDIEQLWHALSPPYAELFAWLDGKQPKPDISNAVTFHPVMLSHPVQDDDLEAIRAQPDEWQIEHKYDGIRVQLVCNANGKAIYSRTGDDISHAFPDVLEQLHFHGVVDGELLIMKDGNIDSFNALQQRLNRKKPTKALLASHPAGVMLYDILKYQQSDVTRHSLDVRREYLEKWVANNQLPAFKLSPMLAIYDEEELEAAYRQAADDPSVEGLMLKRLASPYTAGRPVGQWFKWKREALLADAVIMYAQRGHGKRSSFYSDYTFGVWEGDKLLPIGKTYSGFTDEELKKLDNWIRRHATGRFGPVREVEKALVLEVAFDAVHPSTRHKSGVALRFPRVHRIRWDKPASEADTLDAVKRLIR
ncbi:ATP-dependent DNA ligase [Alteromonas sp. I4]|nr:ATP-dependent DNA ligase [Alteromonas sp. I4]